MKKSILLTSLISIPFLLCACQTQDNVTESTTQTKALKHKIEDFFVTQFYDESRFWGYDGRTNVHTSGGLFLVMPDLSIKDARTSDDWINPEEIKMNQYISGDYFRFVLGYELEGSIQPAFAFNDGDLKENQGTPVYEQVASCTFHPCQIIKIDEKNITRDEDGYIQNISTGYYDIHSTAKLDRITIDIPEKPRSSNAFTYLNNYKGDVYASVQEGVIYSFLSYDPSKERNNEIREITL